MTCFMRSIFKNLPPPKITPPRLPYRTPNILCAFIFHESDDWLAPYKKKQRSPTCFSSGMWPFSKKPYYVATNSFITISFKYIVL